MTLDELRLEIGTEGYDELTDVERDACLSCSTPTIAALRAFDLLRKKYRPSYRLGRMYEDLSSKYIHYNSLYREYQQMVSRGYLDEAE